ncbi:MAG: IS4 family transposase [Chromatiales bacterium]|nr:IS4 family transposase [Chromatiales bacterium]MCK7582356.1 IS4 family transposase [Chromatiales bacterium]
MSTIFETIIQPLIPLLKEEANRLKNDEKTYKLSLYYFTLSLIYVVINQIKSMRLLITELKTKPDLKKLGFILASPSMYSEAFSRYKPEVFQRMLVRLLEVIDIKDIPEIKTLGRFILFDGSLFPAFKTMEWAKFSSKCQALKMHLAYELNRMIPVQFMSTDANYSERQALMALLEAGVTYITDRGYLAFDIFQQITAQQAFFITRIRSNIKATVRTALAVNLPESWNLFLSDITDTLVIFSGDKSKQTYRLICFFVGGELYRITANRFDLKTSEIIMLYAYRWQVELFFRCIKRTLNALHLWNHEPDGIKIQFYIYLIVYVLLIDFKQTLIQENENQTINRQTSIDSSSSPKESPLQKKGNSRLPGYGLVSLLGSKLKKLWKFSIHWLTCIKNLLLHPMTNEHRDTILSIQ